MNLHRLANWIREHGVVAVVDESKGVILVGIDYSDKDGNLSTEIETVRNLVEARIALGY